MTKHLIWACRPRRRRPPQRLHQAAVVSNKLIELVTAKTSLIWRQNMIARLAVVNFGKTLLGLASAGVIVVAVSTGTAVAQELDQELLRRLQQERSMQPRQTRSPLDTARERSLLPKRTTDPGTLKPEIEPTSKPSALEQDYRTRLVKKCCHIER